jgi:hypothetical protein
VDECYCALLGNSALMKMLARKHVTCSLGGLLYATIELGFLCVVHAEAIYRDLQNNTSSSVQFSSVQFSSVQFSSHKLEDSRIRQEDVVQSSSIVDVLTLRVL